MPITIDDAQAAARHILSSIGPTASARLRALAAGPLPWTDIDSECLGPVYQAGAGGYGMAAKRGALVHSYGGSDLRRVGGVVEPVMTALTPLGRAVADLAASPGH